MVQLGSYRLYFPFADDTLSYNCPECGFRCCKGMGWGATTSELVQLRRLYPTLAYFTSPRRHIEAQNVRLLNFSPACYFLRGDGKCDIHVTHGRDLKPTVCRSFPANNYHLSGNVLIVGLHFLCPLKRWVPDSGDYRLNHGEIVADLSRDIDAVVGVRPRQPPGSPTKDPEAAEREFDEALILYEEWCRDLRVDNLLDACAIFDLTAAAAAGEVAPSVPSPESILAAVGELERYRDRLVTFLGASRWLRDPCPAAAIEIRPLCAYVRYLALVAYPWLSAAQACALMGRLFCALEVYLRLVVATNGSRVDLSTVNELFSGSTGLFYLLARIELVPRIELLPDNALNVDLGTSPEADAAGQLIQFVYDENDQQGKTLAQIIDDLVVDPWVRIGLLRSLPVNALRLMRFTAS